MNRVAIFKFKCRHCGSVFDGPITSPSHAPHAFLAAELGTPQVGVQMTMFNMYVCKPGQQYGMADLIGYKMEER